MNNLYVFKYESVGNVFTGELAISANSLVEAQDSFFTWIKRQPVYQHMWNLHFQIREIHYENQNHQSK